jgi:5'-3' exonuclease
VNTTLIVDGQNLLMRAIFAARGSQMSSGGVPTGPLVIFINSLAKHVAEEQPFRLVVCWDGGTSPARMERLPSYKAHRKPVPEDEKDFRDSASSLVRRFLVLAGVHMVQVRDVEADDLIAAAWASLWPRETDKIVILSSDKDFLQLVGPNPQGVETELVRLSSSGTPTDRWTAYRFFDTYGYTAPSWPLVTALAGDTSDGVPGLPGIGPKKAVKLLEAAEWDMNALTLTPEQRAVVAACFDVVDLRNIRGTFAHRPPPWRPTDPGSVMWPDLIEFLDGLELRAIKDRLRLGDLWSNRDLISATESHVSPNGRGD